jgi:hypothetical protein
MPKTSTVMNARVLSWTIGLAFVGFVLACEASYPYIDSRITFGILAGGAVGFALGILFSWKINRKRS